jgi:hypothetical protein
MSLSVASIMNGKLTVPRDHAFREINKHYRRDVRYLGASALHENHASVDTFYVSRHQTRFGLAIFALFAAAIGIGLTIGTGLNGGVTPFVAIPLTVSASLAGGAVYVHRKMKAHSEKPLSKTEVEALLATVAEQVKAAQTLYGQPKNS